MTRTGQMRGLAVALLVLVVSVPVRGQEPSETSLDAFDNLFAVLFLDFMAIEYWEKTIAYHGLHRGPGSSEQWGVWERRDQSGVVRARTGPLDVGLVLRFFPAEPMRIPGPFLTHLLQTAASTEYAGSTVTVTLPRQSTASGDQCGRTQSYRFTLAGGVLFSMEANLLCH